MGDRGVFIVLEGADGVAKSTQAGRLSARLMSRGYHVIATAEPTQRPIGKLVRQGLGNGHAFDRETMALLFAADRRDHVAREIRPTLDCGAVVVCDRYDLSNVVYRAAAQPVVRCTACGWQGDEAPWMEEPIGKTRRQRCPNCDGATRLSFPRYDAIGWARALSRGLPRPDLTIVLDMPIDVAVARLAARGGKPETYDDPSLQRRVLELYRHAAELIPDERVALLDGEGTELDVASRVWDAVLAAEVLP